MRLGAAASRNDARAVEITRSEGIIRSWLAPLIKPVPNTAPSLGGVCKLLGAAAELNNARAGERAPLPPDNWSTCKVASAASKETPSNPRHATSASVCLPSSCAVGCKGLSPPVTHCRSPSFSVNAVQQLSVPLQIQLMQSQIPHLRGTSTTVWSIPWVAVDEEEVCGGWTSPFIFFLLPPFLLFAFPI